MMERLGQLYPREDYRELNYRCGGLLQILGREFGQAARIYSILWIYPDDEAKRSVDKLTGRLPSTSLTPVPWLQTTWFVPVLHKCCLKSRSLSSRVDGVGTQGLSITIVRVRCHR
jgi:hypothetical protein